MMHKVWCSIEEVPYYFSRSSIKFQCHRGWKINNFNPIWVRTPGRLQLSNPSDLACSRSSDKFQSHTGQKNADFDPNWAFPDCDSSLNSPMALKWCTKLDVVYGVGGAVRFLVVGTIGQEERPPRGQLWMEQCLTLLKYWPIPMYRLWLNGLYGL